MRSKRLERSEMRETSRVQDKKPGDNNERTINWNVFTYTEMNIRKPDLRTKSSAFSSPRRFQL
nr:MAG TPA: hypothetical protein [Myoviridae sp. ctPCN11]